MSKNKKDQPEELDILTDLQKAYKQISELKNTISHKKISLEISRKIHKERKENNRNCILQGVQGLFT